MFNSPAFKPAGAGSPTHLPLERKSYLLSFFTDAFRVRERTMLATSSSPAAAAREELWADNHTSSRFWHEDGLWGSALLE